MTPDEKRAVDRLAKAKWREENPGRNAEQMREWRRTHPGRDAAIARKYRKKNRLGILKEQLKRYYGISLEVWNSLMESQGGKCAICGGVPVQSRLCVDHDHKTGRIRGLLCRKCNAALGLFSDSRELLKKADEYLSQ